MFLVRDVGHHQTFLLWIFPKNDTYACMADNRSAHMRTRSHNGLGRMPAPFETIRLLTPYNHKKTSLPVSTGRDVEDNGEVGDSPLKVKS